VSTPSNIAAYRGAIALALCFLSVPASAQNREPPTVPSIEDMQLEQAGRTATTSAGEVGQRQTREDVSTEVAPMSRISNRIENRVQNRLRNRIDRAYDPQANATTPFAVANEAARSVGRSRQEARRNAKP
jgi:hypothetical protein